MSEDPTRYTIASREKSKHLETPLVVSKDGELVRYEDYAQVKAECKDWRAINIRMMFTQVELSNETISLKARLAKAEEHNDALCERMQDLNSELHTASCANANAHKEINRLKEEVKVWKDVGTDNGVACNERAKENQHLENKIARLIQAGELVAEWVQDHIKGQVGCLDPADLTRAWEEAKRYAQHE